MENSDTRRADAVIATAMGWTDIQLNAYVNYGSGRDACGTHPDKIGGWDQHGRMAIPDYHINRNALAEALTWASKDENLWSRFDEHLIEAVCGYGDSGTEKRRAFLLAPPHVIAGALAEAIADDARAEIRS